MAPNAGDAGRLPHQAVADVEDGLVRQIRLTMVDDQALFTEAVDVVRLTIAVVGFLLSSLVMSYLYKSHKVVPAISW